MAEVLQSLSDALAAVVSDAGQSIVSVDARRRLPATGIVYSAEGVIVTAHHVVTREESIRVGLPDGQKVNAEFVGRDPSTDLAVLKVDASDLSVPQWASSESLRVGHLAVAVGRPGTDTQATLGVVSALWSDWRTPAGGLLDQRIQTDVVMYPGFSGGPLVSVSGQFIGLNTSGLARGASIAVPAATISRVTEALLRDGVIKRGYLGVTAQPVRLPEAMSTELGQETGLMLVAVDPASPAGQGGLAMGDTIVAFGETPTRTMDELQAALTGDRVGESVSVRIIRGGQVHNVSVTIGERS